MLYGGAADEILEALLQILSRHIKEERRPDMNNEPFLLLREGN